MLRATALRRAASRHALGRRAISSKIVTLPGDGVGPEVCQQAVKVLQQVASARGHEFTFDEQLIGGAAIEATGDSLPDETLSACLDSDAVMMGSVGLPKYDAAPVRPEQGLLKIRKEMDLFANLRPVMFFDELLECSPLRPEIVRGVDFLCVRELVGGIYFGQRTEEGEYDDGRKEVAHDTMEYSVPEVERIVRLAAEFAMQRGGKLCSVDKANVLASSRLWRRTATALIEREFPEVELEHRLVDSCAMDIITKPRSFDVMVTENMFGDILTDEASVLSGSLGLLPSASLSSPGRPGLYEPIHGSAPDIMGQGVVNPVAAILSAAMLLRHSLHLHEEATAVEAAVRASFAAGARTVDLGGDHGTEAMGEAVLANLEL